MNFKEGDGARLTEVGRLAIEERELRVKDIIEKNCNRLSIPQVMVFKNRGQETTVRLDSAYEGLAVFLKGDQRLRSHVAKTLMQNVESLYAQIKQAFDASQPIVYAVFYESKISEQ
jgi:hypothetical protein